eukprot:222112_1
MYVETKEFIAWSSTNKREMDVSIKANHFEVQQKEIQNMIQNITNVSSNMNKLLNSLTILDERVIFGVFGEYLVKAFDLSVNKILNILQNNIFKGSQQYIPQKYHNMIMEYFEENQITGNKLKSIGEKQFEISLAKFFNDNDTTLPNSLLNRLYNNLLQKLKITSNINILDEKENEDGHKMIKLFYVDSPDLTLTTLAKLFAANNHVLNASQVLICTKKTSLEEINCFLYRFYHDKLGLVYSLIEPENLNNKVGGLSLNTLTEMQKQKSLYNGILVVITSDKNVKWYSTLKIYLQSLQNMMMMTPDEMTTFHQQYICSELNHFKSENVNNQNPFCMVFASDEPCVGKSYQIKKICEENNFVMICIPFNAPTVDKDFVADRLIQSQLCNDKNRKFAFHCNISSYCGKDINYLLFQILILRHITKSSGESFYIK